MKKLVNISACLVFVFLLAGVSFAKSKDTETYERTVQANACSSVTGKACDAATTMAVSVSFQALAACSKSAISDDCKAANAAAERSQANADYICDSEVAPVSTGPVASYSPTEKKSIGKTKILDSKQSFGDASAR